MSNNKTPKPETVGKSFFWICIGFLILFGICLFVGLSGKHFRCGEDSTCYYSLFEYNGYKTFRDCQHACSGF